MYAKGKAGRLKGFTGIDNPYEEAINPELHIEATDLIPEEAAQEIMLYISQKGFI